MKALGVLASSKFRGQEAVEDLPGKTFLEQNAKSKLFYYFPSLTGSGAISNGNDGLEDRSPGSRTATVVNSPSVRNITVNSITVPTLEAVGTNAISIGDNGAGLFDEDFELFYVFQIEDGIPPGEHRFIGAWSTAGSTNFNFLITTTGKLLVRYRTPSADSRWDSTGAVLPDGVNGVHILRIKYDFTDDVFGIWLDETPIPGSFISGNMASLDPSTWALDRDIYIGNFNNGSPISNPVTNSIIAVAVTDILTDQEAADITEALTTFGVFTPSVKPTIQASALTAVSGQTSMLLSWTGGNGTNKLVVGRQGSAVNAPPTDGVSYTANTVFGSGSQIGSGNYVVYAGTSNTVTVTGLTRDTLYFFDVYEFNATGLRYLTTIGSNTTEEGVRTDYINDQSFATYNTDYTEVQVVGFTSNVTNGELVLSGNPKGWQDRVERNEWDESLEEFELEILVRLDDELTSDTVGIGLGIKNDIDNEPNRAVYGTLVTAVGSSAFGRVQLYSGNGSTSPTNFSLKNESSGQLEIAEGNVYKFVLKRTIAGNDAIYQITITNMTDPELPSETAGWTEIGRPSSAFYGTTIRAYIHQNGGEHAIDYFIARRTGDQGGVVEPPPVEDFDIYVTTNGNDTTGDGSISAPFRTNNRGLIAIQALGGSVGSKTMSTGPGVFTETSFLSPPTNLGLWQGAGRGVTEVRGTQGLYTATNAPSSQFGFRSGNTRYLVSFINRGTIDCTIKSITFNGQKNTGGNTNSMRGGVAITNSHGVKLEDIEIQYFNTSGIKLENVNTFSLKNFMLRDSGGVNKNQAGQTTFVYYTMPWYNVGGSTILNEGSYNIVIDTGEVIVTASDGGGFGFAGGGGSAASGIARWQRNVEIKNVFFNFNSTTDDDDGHRFNIEWNDCDGANVWVHDCYFRSNLSFGQIGRDYVSGKTRFSNNRVALENHNSLTFEMQISNCEVDHNYVTGVRNGCFSISNHPINPNTGSVWHAAENDTFRATHGDWHIHHNVIETRATQGFSFSAGIYGSNAWPISNVLIENDTIIFNTTAGQPFVGVAIGTNGANGNPSTPYQSSNITIQNCAFYGQPPTGCTLWRASGGTLTNGISRNNKSTHFNVTHTRAGVTGGSGQNNTILGGNLGLKLTGAKPDPFYRPNIGSPLDGTGFGGTYVGALAPA